MTSINLPRSVEAVVVGVSAGAVEALSVLLPNLPENYRLPVLIVVHVPPDKDSILAELFRGKCKINVREADDKESLRPGTVYFAPPDYHLLVEHNRHLSLSSEEPVHYSRPSIDMLFESAADAFRERLVGVILTGANADGATGLKAIRAAGGTTVVQDPETAQATAMPRAALEACPESTVLNLAEIAAFLRDIGDRAI